MPEIAGKGPEASGRRGRGLPCRVQPVSSCGKKLSLVCCRDFWEEAEQAPELLRKWVHPEGLWAGWAGGEGMLNNSLQRNN